MYTDDTILTKGKSKYISLCRVSPDYLLSYYKNKGQDKQLIEYIENNMERIIMRKEGIIQPPILELICDKIPYHNEKHAKLILSKIKSNEHNHKLPVRAYECDKCSQWHLTSQTLEEFNNLNK